MIAYLFVRKVFILYLCTRQPEDIAQHQCPYKITKKQSIINYQLNQKNGKQDPLE